ncbi:MAG: methionine synthase [Caldisphaeraceae archaeon]|nr:methionine synthase [Caldisphaeraceae archaeon]MEB3691777.1 methionine synthase [Caldisphaeraceae archaeon]MEB3798579.1 methionine synthase [Caldisphaeraceae archaeon]
MTYEVPKLFPTTVVGSYPKLGNAAELIKKRERDEIGEEEFHVKVRTSIDEVVKDYIDAGIDILSDGEQSREDMVVYFAQRLKGYSKGDWVRIFDNVYFRKPIIKERLERAGEMIVTDWKYAESVAGGRPVKLIITGPYTMLEWSFDLFYKDREELIMDFAKIIREEVLEGIKAGARYVQVDEPALSTRPWKEEAYLLKEALKYIFNGVDAKKIIHICYGRLEKILPYVLDYPVDQFDLEFKNSNFRLLPYLKEYGFNKELGYGVVDVHTLQVETVDEIIEAVERLMKLDLIGPEKVYLDPDCGLKRLPRDVAKEKLSNISKAATSLRKRYG